MSKITHFIIDKMPSEYWQSCPSRQGAKKEERKESTYPWGRTDLMRLKTGPKKSGGLTASGEGGNEEKEK